MKLCLRILAVSSLLLPPLAAALELGFESSLLVEESRTDNAVPERDTAGSETLGIFAFSLFGQLQSDRVEGGFVTELHAERVLQDEADNNNETVTYFYGGATLATPLRSLNWYFGDVLAGVLAEDQLQSMDSSGNRQLNIFVTGPEISTRVGVRKTLDLSLYYAHQSDDTETELDSLYNLRADFSSELSGGRSWGLRLSDIYTQKPDSALASDDYNRASGAVFIRRQRSLTQFDAELGMTQYYSDGEGTDGLRLALDWSRSLSQATSVVLSLSHDLTDQTLGTLQDLSSGQTAREDNDGVVAQTGASLRYQYLEAGNAFYLNLAASESDFLLVTDQSGFTTRNTDLHDSRWFSLSTGLTRALSASLSLTLDVNLQRSESLNLSDEIDSRAASLIFNYALNNRWSLRLGGRYLQSEGLSSDFADNGLVVAQTPLDESEHRYFLGLHWAPPTRASRAASGVVRSFR